MLIRTKITKNLFYIFILIVVGFIFTSCRESQHNIVKVDKVPSSCIENGIDEGTYLSLLTDNVRNFIK